MIVVQSISSSLTRDHNKNGGFFLYRTAKNGSFVLVLPVLIFATLTTIFLLECNSYNDQEFNIDFLKGSGMRGLELKKATQSEEAQLFHFLHTTKESDFNTRSIRAVESVFYHYPNAQVVIHIPQDGDNIGLYSDLSEKVFLPLINDGYNVTVRPFQLQTLVNAALSQDGSIVAREPAENWMTTKILPNVMGYFWFMDISDLVRLLVLYVHGGIYLDTDILVAKPLTSLPNSIGFERPDGPSGAVLKFEKGNKFIGDCINEYFSNFISSTQSWGHVGPSLLARVFTRNYDHCRILNRVELGKTDLSCPVFALYKDAFYPDVSNCLIRTPGTDQKKEAIRENSFVVHTYNQRTFGSLHKMNKSKLLKKDILCNWLYRSWCIHCENEDWTS